MLQTSSYWGLAVRVGAATAALLWAGLTPSNEVIAQTGAVENAAVRWGKDGPAGTPEFSRHVMPLLSKLGCNNRACHGSFQGQNGFRLSLFGHDQAEDHAALTGGEEPRVNRASPEESLMLQMPVSELLHGGGQRFELDSWEFRLFREWIAAGAKYEPQSETELERLEIVPAEIQLSAEGEDPVPLRVTARFEDGSLEDVTPLTVFSTNDESVAVVSDDGLVGAAGRGDTAIVAIYAGAVVTSQVINPHAGIDQPFPQYPAENPIDDFVADKLRKVGIQPSDRAGDAEFLRRVYLDVIGTLPTAEEARRFLSDSSPEKRARLIDELLDRPEYAMYWATRFSDWTGNDNRSTPHPRKKTGWLWHHWLQEKLDRNVPYDELVAGFVLATSREGRSRDELAVEYQALQETLRNGFDEGLYASRRTNDVFWKKGVHSGSDKTIPTLLLANAFLGVRLECAQCHKHPFDRWTQEDFEHFRRFFEVVENVPQPEMEENLELKGNDYRAIDVTVSVKDKATPRLLGGTDVPLEEGEDPRRALWEWMRSPDNPYFAPSLVNRLWGHYFGVGIVEPIDDFNAGNPPSNPQLLEWLAEEFIRSGFDLKHMHRTVLNSRTYQLTWKPNETNRLDERNFSRALLRRLPAEVLVDAINQVTGTLDPYQSNHAPEGTRAIGLGITRMYGNPAEYALSVFGRPLRTQTCDCERSSETALAQALYLLNDVEVNGKIADSEGRLDRLLEEIPDDEALIEELYLGALARAPRPEELRQAREFVAAARNRREGMQDVLWSLINLREFLFNH